MSTLQRKLDRSVLRSYDFVSKYISELQRPKSKGNDRTWRDDMQFRKGIRHIIRTEYIRLCSSHPTLSPRHIYTVINWVVSKEHQISFILLCVDSVGMLTGKRITSCHDKELSYCMDYVHDYPLGLYDELIP